MTEIKIKSLEEVKKWNTKRILAYKNRMHKHLSYIQTPDKLYHLVFDKGITTLKDDKTYLETYIGSLKEILKTRENVEK